MYRSWVMETFECPRWSAPIRADRLSSSISVAAVLRKLWVVTSGTPSSARAVRHSLPKLLGSRNVPAVDGKITVC